MTFSQFRRMQLKELNEFLTDAIAENHGNLSKTARALRMHQYVLRRQVKRHGLIENYGSRRHIRGDATQCRVCA